MSHQTRRDFAMSIARVDLRSFRWATACTRSRSDTMPATSLSSPTISAPISPAASRSATPSRLVSGRTRSTVSSTSSEMGLAPTRAKSHSRSSKGRVFLHRPAHAERTEPEEGKMVFEESVALSQPFEEVVAKVKQSFAASGFGILTEIDVQATLREKLGKQMDRYLILGACNPTLASRALDIEPEIGVLLPCNVVVRDNHDSVLVEAMDPGVMTTLVSRDELRPVADEARRLIGEALNRLAQSA